MPMTQPPPHPYTCPCCGHLVFDEPPGSYGRCPICFWQDDVVQFKKPTYSGGANRPSLAEAQANFARYGTKDGFLNPRVRPPRPDEPLDPTWRAFDVTTDLIHDPGHPGIWEQIDSLLPAGEQLRVMHAPRTGSDAWYIELDIYRADGSHYRSELQYRPRKRDTDPTETFYYWRPRYRAIREEMGRQRSQVVRTADGFEELVTWDDVT